MLWQEYIERRQAAKSSNPHPSQFEFSAILNFYQRMKTSHALRMITWRELGPRVHNRLAVTRERKDPVWRERERVLCMSLQRRPVGRSVGGREFNFNETAG